VPTNYSITIFGVFGTEQISKYKKNPNYKHQIANGSVLSKVEGLTTLSPVEG
jgi:hypothetical protein